MSDNPHPTRIGIGHWAQKGIAGRGVLIDYLSYAEKKASVSTPFPSTSSR
jgi:hypothetical protein